ncbi:MAG TPA: hypothetical protein VIB39_16515 [Candidatus Angelobacter sp.]|jgi:hypothetical protein
MRTKNVLFLAGLVFIFSICSFAQNDISFSLGGLTSSDQTLTPVGITCAIGATCGSLSSSINNGIAFEGAFAHRLFGFHLASIDVELPVLGAPGRNLRFGGSSSGSPVSFLFFTPSARLRFLNGRAISPFGSIGGGLAHFGFSGGDRNGGAAQFGGGLDFKSPFPRVAFRAEVRDFYSASSLGTSSGLTQVSPNRANNIFAGGGVVLRF